MINNIIAFSIKNKLIIGFFTIALIVRGVWSMTKVPVDAQQDITNNQVQVIPPYLSYDRWDRTGWHRSKHVLSLSYKREAKNIGVECENPEGVYYISKTLQKLSD